LPPSCGTRTQNWNRCSPSPVYRARVGGGFENEKESAMDRKIVLAYLTLLCLGALADWWLGPIDRTALLMKVMP
jgi:hypothetical protein